ncbi:MAG: hypothetical protein K2H20_00825 [Bacilli bacterium]|nr:hypothetical protein [Bacilli bacterium]
MKIGIDIDDTVANTDERIIQEALKYDKEVVKGRGFKDKNAYTFMEKFYWNVMDVDGFMKVIRKGKFFSELNPIEDAVMYVNKLYDEGNEIYFITRRKNNFLTKLKTKKWLKKTGFKFHKLIMGGEDKATMCKEMGIKIFVDNDEKNVRRTGDVGITSILKGTMYTSEVKDLTKLETWEEIYKYIEKVK